MPQNTFPGVRDLRIDHVVIQTVSGMINGATTFFEKLGYAEIRSFRGVGGRTRILFRVGTQSVHLIDAQAEVDPPINENRVSFAVEDPHTLVVEIQEWAFRTGMNAELEPLGGNRYAIRLPQLLCIALEFVPG